MASETRPGVPSTDVEAALRRSEQQLQLCLQAAGAGAWTWDLATNIVTWDDAVYALLGLDSATTPPSFDAFIAHIHPDDRDAAIARAASGIALADHRDDYRIVRPDGEVRWVSVMARTLAVADRPPHQMVGVLFDATDRQRREAESRRLLAETERARAQAVAAVERIGRLQAVTAALSEALTPEEVGRVILGQGMAGFGAVSGVVALTTDDGAALEVVAGTWHAQDRLDSRRRLPIDAPLLTAEAARTSALVCVESPEALARRYPHHVGVDPAGRAWAGVPLLVHGRTIGAIGLSFAGANAFEADDRAQLTALGQQCAQAIERARLYAVEHRSRMRAESDRRQLQQVIDVMPVGVVIADAAGWVEMANPSAGAIVGNVVGRQMQIDGNDGQALQCRQLDGTPYRADGLPMQRSVLHGETVQGEPMLIRSVAGHDVPILVTSAPIRGPNRTLAGVILVLQDISLLKALEQTRDELLGSISHDLKNPLTTILGQAQLAVRYARRLSPEAAQRPTGQMQGIVGAAEKMQQLIDELMDLARIQAGAVTLSRSATDLARLVRDGVAVHARLTDRHRLEVTTEPAEIVGPLDSDRLARVVDNLLGNAIKFSPDGGTITVRLRQETVGAAPWAVLTVQDEGVGIPAAEIPTIFERFRRGSNVAGRIAGTGIGLAGARQIVVAHGGTINVASEEGRGSTFTVRLPLDGTPSWFPAGRAPPPA